MAKVARTQNIDLDDVKPITPEAFIDSIKTHVNAIHAGNPVKIQHAGGCIMQYLFLMLIILPS